MKLLRSGLRLARQRAKSAWRRLRRAVRRRLRAPAIRIELVETLAATQGAGGTQTRLRPVRRWARTGLLTLRAQLTPVNHGVRIRVRADLRPIGIVWTSPSEGADTGTLEAARREANRLVLAMFLQARTATQGARRTLKDAGGSVEEQLRTFSIRPTKQVPGVAPAREFRRLFVLPMACEAQSVNERLPPPFFSRVPGQILLYAAVDGGTPEDRMGAGRERSLVFGCGVVAGLAAEGQTTFGLVPFWEKAVRLDRPHLPGDELRAAYVFDTNGFLLSVGTADRKTLLRFKARPARGLRSGDPLPLLFSPEHVKYRFDALFGGIKVQRVRSDFAVNRVYHAARLPGAGPSPEDFVLGLTGIQTRAQGSAFFCPRVDVHTTTRELPWSSIQYRASGPARTDSLLQPHASHSHAPQIA